MNEDPQATTAETAPEFPSEPRPEPAAEPGPMAGDPSGRGGSAGDRAGQEPGDLVLAMSPRQIIGGFALLAGLILMLRRSRRKR